MPLPKKSVSKPKSTFTGRFTNKEKTKVTWDLKKPFKKPKSSFKQISDNKVEWTFKQEQNTFKKYIDFIKRIKQSKNSVELLKRFTTYKTFISLYKTHPKATTFFFNRINKILKSKNERLLVWAPGTLYVGPIVIYARLHKTEKILNLLEKRGTSLERILSNENASNRIMHEGILINTNTEKISKRYSKFLEYIENEVNKK